MMKCVSQVHVSGYVNNKMKIFWGVDKLGVENATSWWRGRHVTQPSLPYPGASTVGLTGAGQEW